MNIVVPRSVQVTLCLALQDEAAPCNEIRGMKLDWSVHLLHVFQNVEVSNSMLGSMKSSAFHQVLHFSAIINMLSNTRLRRYAVALLSISAYVVSASASLATSNTTVTVLSDTFTPPQVFVNENLVRNINLEKSYARETTNLVIKNIGQEDQSKYYYLFPSKDVAQVGGFEVKDKKNAASGAFRVELAQFESPKYDVPSES